MLHVIDDTLICDLFAHEQNAKVIFSFFNKHKIRAKIASNIHKKLFSNPLLDDLTKARLDTVLDPYGNEAYNGLSFEESTINMINLHSDFDEVHFITRKLYTQGIDSKKEIVLKKNLIISTPKKMIDIIKYSCPKFMEWYEALELLKIQTMDEQSKAKAVSCMEGIDIDESPDKDI
jgi:hypothetical protein